MGTHHSLPPTHTPFYHSRSQWPEQSKPHASRPVVRLPESSSLPRPPASPPRPPVVSRSPTDTAREPSLSVRSDDTRSPPSSSSASSPSSASSVRSPRTSRPTSASSPPPSWPSRSLPRPTSSPSSKTPTSPLSTPSVSPFSQRTSSSPDVSEASDKQSLWSTTLWSLSPLRSSFPQLHLLIRLAYSAQPVLSPSYMRLRCILFLCQPILRGK